MATNGEMSMKLFIGGVRGSQPCIGAKFEEFGGDTTSLLVTASSGHRLILDAGTGMRCIAKELSKTKPGPVTILFSHYHLDHLAGMMMNPLFYNKAWSFNLIGPTFSDGGVRDAVTKLLAPPYWPISYENMGATLTFTEFQPPGIDIDQLKITGCPVPHPGGCMAYRIDETNCDSSLIFATDIEWQKRAPEFEKAFMSLCTEPKPADMLIIDAHFARADQQAFAGWGHSSWEDCLDIAESASIRHVLLCHHAPEADDKTLLALESQVRKRNTNAMLARSGQCLVVGR